MAALTVEDVTLSADEVVAQLMTKPKPEQLKQLTVLRKANPAFYHLVLGTVWKRWSEA